MIVELIEEVGGSIKLFTRHPNQPCGAHLLDAAALFEDALVARIVVGEESTTGAQGHAIEPNWVVRGADLHSCLGCERVLYPWQLVEQAGGEVSGEGGGSEERQGNAEHA